MQQSLAACHEPGHHHFIDRLAVLNGLVSGVVLYPQIFIILYWGVENNLAVSVLALIVLNNIVWTLYGLHRGIIPTVLSGVLNVLAGVILIFI